MKKPELAGLSFSHKLLSLADPMQHLKSHPEKKEGRGPHVESLVDRRQGKPQNEESEDPPPQDSTSKVG